MTRVNKAKRIQETTCPGHVCGVIKVKCAGATCFLCTFCSVMLVMKLGDELLPQLLEVIDFLGRVQGLRVVVEPHVHHEYLHGHTTLQNVYTYTPEEQTRWVSRWLGMQNRRHVSSDLHQHVRREQATWEGIAGGRGKSEGGGGKIQKGEGRHV